MKISHGWIESHLSARTLAERISTMTDSLILSFDQQTLWWQKVMEQFQFVWPLYSSLKFLGPGYLPNTSLTASSVIVAEQRQYFADGKDAFKKSQRDCLRCMIWVASRKKLHTLPEWQETPPANLMVCVDNLCDGVPIWRENPHVDLPGPRQDRLCKWVDAWAASGQALGTLLRLWTILLLVGAPSPWWWKRLSLSPFHPKRHKVCPIPHTPDKSW